ncbi:3-hydroxybenzoate 6-hydroxylase 1 [Pseudovibrio axinellae]|uniref:3-hydroxybenzoate 6-hydroxylase 1 n=1 Tax=Pseudovibrio axinellae TaxID=989403 RepID=A0A161V8F9_9HYPH|nr:FAD-dependent oxidoreductase [Pseudovibrio axinellae]KZL21259.1 3-hydroxybenzoate 6-hydroxylase 1 [Pseudovibrio axinellae]SEQ93843.1 salicylate hydroxylase [Pseudovibrio axinellae]
MIPKNIAITGAGIAGLTTALYLARKGHRVYLFDAATELSEVGAGIQVTPNAIKCLQALGLGPALMARAVSPSSIIIRSGNNGAKLATVPLGRIAEDRYGAPYYVIHRADLQQLLLEAVLETAEVQLHLNTKIEDAEITDTAVKLIGPDFSQEQAGLPETFDLLIGADGVRSNIRQNALGGAPARHTGFVAYRATAKPTFDLEHFLSTSGLWLARNTHLVQYPVKNGKLLNIVAVTKEKWQETSWSHPVERDHVRGHFQKWAPEALRLIDLPETWTRWSLCQVDTRHPWTKGPVTLIGDAAHAILPFSAQGAAMAIEDAAVLSKMVDKHGATPLALQSYEAARRPRIERMSRLVKQNDWVYHMGFPLCIARNIVMKSNTPSQLLDRLNWIYEWTPEDDID